MGAVLVLLPPSETKRTGGAGPPLAMSALSFPDLDPLRKVLVDELVELARAERRTPPAWRRSPGGPGCAWSAAARTTWT